MRIQIEISLGRNGFPTREELEIRNTLEDLLMENEVGEVVGAGSGMGIMDITIDVADVDDTSSIVQSKMDLGVEIEDTSWILQTVNG